MKSFQTLYNLFTTYTQNTSATNTSLGKQLINDTQRYLLQDFFNNERTVSQLTQGGTSYTLTANIAGAANSATLSSVWTGQGLVLIQVTFSDGEQRNVKFAANSASITWTAPLYPFATKGGNGQLGAVVFDGTTTINGNAPIANVYTLTNQVQATNVTINSGVTVISNNLILYTGTLTNSGTEYLATSTITIGGQQYYPMPADYSKTLNPSITVGNLQWGNLRPILTRQEWDMMNVFPYYADIPDYYYIFPGGDHGTQIGIWPIPSTTGNVINITYKYRTIDLSMDDYSTGTITATNGSNIVTGTGFTVTNSQNTEMRWLQIPQPAGDGVWYQVLQVTSSTSITLMQPYGGATVTTSSGAYTLGQMPLLNEDFQDLLVYRPLTLYFSSINKDVEKAAQFKTMYEEGMERLQKYCATDVVDVNLGRRVSTMNANLFYFGRNNT